MFNSLEFFHSTNGYSPISSSTNESEQRIYHNSYHHHNNIPPLAVARATSYQNMEPTTSTMSSSPPTAIATISSSTSSSTLPNQYHAQHSTNHNQYAYASALRYDQFTRQNTRASSLNAIGDSMSEIIVSNLWSTVFGHSTAVCCLYVCFLSVG